MNRIDSRTVEYTSAIEVTTVEEFNSLLDAGYSIPAAAKQAFEWAIDQGAERRDLTREFVEHLSEDTVLVARNCDVLYTPKGRALMLRSEGGVMADEPEFQWRVTDGAIPDVLAIIDARAKTIDVPLSIAQVAYGQRNGELEGPDRLRVIIANTPEEHAAIGHVRGWCHDGTVCPICKAGAR